MTRIPTLTTAGLLGLWIVLAGCGRDEPARPEGAGTRPAPPATRSAAEAERLLVGAWDYDLRYANGDVVPCVRVFAPDGTGHQYARQAGESGKQSFRWRLRADATTLTLSYSETMLVDYLIEKLEPTALVMTAQVGEPALPEEHSRR